MFNSNFSFFFNFGKFLYYLVFKTEVPFGRSNIKLVREFLDGLDLENKIFIDLGSGDGQ